MKLRATFVGAALSMWGMSAIAGETDPAPVEPAPGADSLLATTAEPYVRLRADIAAIESDGMTNAKALRTAHNRLSSHDTDATTQAYIAYAALVAADVEVFANAIEERTKRKRNRKAFIDELTTNPVMVREIKGADAAIAAVMEMAARDATRINELGETYISQAYEMQRKGWARKKLASTGMARVNIAEKWGQTRPWPEMAPRPAIRSNAGNLKPNLEAFEDWSPSWSASRKPPLPDSKSGILMSQILVLAARYAIDDVQPQHLTEYAQSRPTNRCFVNARLNFNQCIAATRTPYEEAFCIGTHGLNDVSRCVGWPASAGAVK